MITIKNLSKQDLTVARGITVPRSGSVPVHADVYKIARANPTVMSWFNKGWLYAEEDLADLAIERPAIIEEHPPRTLDGRDDSDLGAPGTDDAETKEGAQSGSEGASETDEAKRTRLMAEAESLGIGVSDRWKTETIERRIAEARKG